MAIRYVVSRSGLSRLMEGNWRCSASSPRSFSDVNGRVFSEEERAQEALFIKKMETERMEKLKKKTDQEKTAQNDKSEKKDEDDVPKC